MSDTVIEVNNLSKKFCRSLKRSLYYGTLDAGRAMMGFPNRNVDLRTDEFWALDDISFTLKRGDSLGLIGANGSGKTTLLRLLSGIFPPDKGRIHIRGRVASLIAVGAGFHPHMSGAENIYLNGVLLGLSRSEIKRRFDEIVEFAEIGEFIEAPVSTYSSGMRVRLGFSIAAHTKPEILLVDEVMSVGDTRFRRKASEAMTRLLKENKTSLVLVSHNAFTVRDQCDTAILLSKGRVAFYGNVDQAYEEYHRIEAESHPQIKTVESDFEFFQICSGQGENVIVSGEPFTIEFALHHRLLSEMDIPIKITIFDRENTPLLCLVDFFKPKAWNQFASEPLPLINGTYYVQCKVGTEFYGVSVHRNHIITVCGNSQMVHHPVCYKIEEVSSNESMLENCFLAGSGHNGASRRSTRNMGNLRPLFDKYNTNKGYKHEYDLVYEKDFHTRRNDSITLLEIGIYEGGSLLAWLDYFPKARIFGIDIRPDFIPDENRRRLAQSGRVELEFQDAKAGNLFDEQFDFIIDDGDHNLESQLAVFKTFHSALKEGGVYYIEDIRKEATYKQYDGSFVNNTPDKYETLVSTIKQLGFVVEKHDGLKANNTEIFRITRR